MLNAADEVAVEAFLQERVGFTDIARIVEGALAGVPYRDLTSIEDVLAVDAEARAAAREQIRSLS